MLFPHFHGLYVSNYVYFVARCTPYIFLCVSSPGALQCQAHVQQIIDQARISTKDEVKPSVGELKDAYTLIRSSYDLWLLQTFMAARYHDWRHKLVACRLPSPTSARGVSGAICHPSGSVLASSYRWGVVKVVASMPLLGSSSQVHLHLVVIVVQ